MHVFKGPTADDAWLEAAAYFSGLDAPLQTSRAGVTRECLGASFHIDNPRQRWVFSRSPAINPAFALAEVVWIVAGRNDSAFINHWNPKLPEFAGKGPRYHGAYGHRIRSQFGFDQLERAYHTLSANPDSRQVVIQIWNSSIDFPSEGGHPTNADIPCNICSFAKVRDGRLEWTQILRSNDLVLGTPHNFVQFSSLQEILAGWLDVEVGAYRHFADSLHIYDRDLLKLEGIERTKFAENTDSVAYERPKSIEYFTELARRMDEMRDPHLTRHHLRRLTQPYSFPTPLQNWLVILGADSARRRNWTDLSLEIASGCSNPALRLLWENWFDRWWTSFRREKTSETAAQPALPLEFA
jgi:thymidylate synthase